MKKILIPLLLFSMNSFSYSVGQLKPTKTNTPPVIDGRIDDEVWKEAIKVSGFKSFAPDFGKDGSEKTVAYAAYDSDYLYYAFYCFDREPGKIKSSISSRDNIRSDDWVCINLDTFNDHQALYAFYVNPAGIQADSRYAAGQEDFSADFIWYSAGQIQPDGYSVEIKIPLKSIRFAKGDTVTMSVFLERFISRNSEHASYPELDPAKGMAFLTQMVPLEYHGLNRHTLLEILPAFTYSQKFNRIAGNLDRTENRGDISFTSKLGITSDLILDGTYNPDFSQIEADAGQVDVNLRYQLYYPEKRSFFQEGSDTYNIGATQSSEIDPVISLIHTRTIVNPITGFKLSGKIGKLNTIGMMYTIDELQDEKTQLYGNYAYSPVIRYKQAFADDSYVGALFTNRAINDHYNSVYGLDGIVRLTQSSTLEMNGFISNSKLNGNSDLTTGNTFGLHYNYHTRNFFTDLSAKSISQNFDSQSGYITRTGIFYFTGLFRPKFYPENSFIQRIELDLFSAQTKDLPSSLWETYNYVSSQFYFLGSMVVRIKYSASTEIFAAHKFNTGGFQIILGGLIGTKINFSLSYKRSGSVYYSDAPYQGYSDRLNAHLIYKPNESIESYSTFIYSNFYNESDSKLVYEYPIFRERLTYQFNKYLFFRGVLEYNKYKKQLITDYLVSFTYVPGTVIHVGYGSLYQKTEWNENEYRYADSENFLITQRGFFFKMAYLWRL